MLMDVFKSAMQRKSVKDSDLYDWEKETSEEDSVNVLQATLAAAALNNNNTTNVINQSQKNANVTNGGSLVTPYGDNHNHNHIQQPQSLNNNNSNMNNLNQVKDQELNNNIESSLKNENMITNEDKLVNNNNNNNNSNTADLHASPRRMAKGLERISSKRNTTPNNILTNTNSANAMAVTPLITSGIGTSGTQPSTALDRDTLSNNQSQQRRSRYIEQEQKGVNNKAAYQQPNGQPSGFRFNFFFLI